VDDDMALSSSERMRGIRQKDTAPEVAVRQIVHGLGARFRVCPRALPGRPDIANRRGRWAVFVHGCFWHGHDGCRLYTVPKTNSSFWREKIRANRERDGRKESQLRELGFVVLVVWQCELDHPQLLRRRLRTVVRRGGRSAA
jgi:DNA mismatch endonuclease (patch repair protein)